MKKAMLSFVVLLIMWIGAWFYFSDEPPKPMATCKDGTVSHSRNRSGTCSRHGGVLQWKESK